MSESSPYAPYAPYANRNVKAALALSALAGVADAVWYNGVALPAYLYALSDAAKYGKNDDNEMVGLAEAASGLAQLAFALPVGYLADRVKRSRVVAFGGCAALIAIVVTLHAVWVGKSAGSDVHKARTSFQALVASMVVWGLVEGISQGPAQALFADSVPSGRRSELYTTLYATYILGGVVGPILSIVLFQTISSDYENWSLEDVAPVFMIGVLLEIPMACTMFLFDDKFAVEENVESDEEDATLVRPLLDDDRDDRDDDDRDDDQDPSSPPQQYAVPVVLTLSSIVGALGSGASVKFFPLFFRDCGLSPTQVQCIYVLVPLAIVSLSFLATRMAKRLGRIETCVLFSTLGVLLLTLMTILEKSAQKSNAATQKLVLVSLYLLRTGCANCTYPLTEAIMMDSVPKSQRARWKSLESIAVFGWAGSALLGGKLADDNGYGSSFVLTASLQMLGATMLFPLRHRTREKDFDSVP